MTMPSWMSAEDGIVIRRLWLHEREQWKEHLLRLNPVDRRNRFAGAVNDDFIRAYCDRDEPLGTTLIGAFADGELRGVAEFRLLNQDWPRRAELAFSVEEGYQGRGIGSELFRRMVMFARNRSVQKVFISTEPSNERMRAVARKFGMELSTSYGEVEGRLEVFWPNYASYMEEFMAEGTALLQEAGNRLLRWPAA